MPTEENSKVSSSWEAKKCKQMELHDSRSTITVGIDVVVQIYRWFKFDFPLFFSMLI